MPNPASAREQARMVANGLSHKVRNSLNAMRAHIALLQKFTASCGEERVPRQINKLEDAVVGLEEMVKEFLALASPAKNEWEEVELVSLIREVLDFVAMDLEQGQVSVVEEFAPRLPKVYVDRNKLKRALLNLVVNARQAMPQGGRLTARARRPKRGYVLLEISDTGGGISEEDTDRIFEPFFSSKPGGLGLGLAVAKRTIDDVRGQISFSSKVGEGTTFSILLPTAARQKAALERLARHQQWLSISG